MYGESKGYSLTVLIITIAVILIITTTAVMSIKMSVKIEMLQDL